MKLDCKRPRSALEQRIQLSQLQCGCFQRAQVAADQAESRSDRSIGPSKTIGVDEYAIQLSAEILVAVAQCVGRAFSSDHTKPMGRSASRLPQT